ncbi:FAD-binding protein [Streptomyces broussonetiae]|uniref:FAD-binding protein n=1 Tax=Streptomyces broussonetiae TaxID=2686304 RepID=A0A6I6N2Q5_9ACTN|nr:hypothetical protein [Streptomyces broussonetiae]QHA03267.1 FAD-binding protein [Streptomyces broussonetiae]
MALLDPEPGKLRPRATGGPATDRVPDDRASGTPDTLRNDLVRLLGERKVLHSVSDLVKYASDASPYRFVPMVVVIAENVGDVAAVLRYARDNRREIVFRAAGTSLHAQDGTLYFLYATGTSDLTGVWRLRPGGTPGRIAALPANGLPNGLALDRHTGLLYVADSVLGTVWRVPVAGGTPTRWAAAPELRPAGFLGANGIKVHNGAVWVSNLDKGTVLRVPLTCHGGAGPVETRATALVDVDDFGFTGAGDSLLAAINKDNEVALVRSDGTHSIVLTAADGLENPTSLAVRGGTAYIASGAYFTNSDPNVLAVHVEHGK